MLLSSVILVLREVLEAAMLISVLLAMSLNQRQGIRWLCLALLLGLGGSVLFASFLDVITDALDGAGQEITNASLQLMVYLTTLLIVGVVPHSTTQNFPLRAVSCLMSAAVACVVIREGVEIMVYLAGFSSVQEQRAAVYAGSAIGAGIGVSLGVLLFSALRALQPKSAQLASVVLISLMASGMVLQSITLLEQVDWLSAGAPLWDSSGLVSEQSIAGELLYAMFGYEASPSAIQVIVYGFCLLLMFAVYHFPFTSSDSTQ